jgi:predicted glycoside hydrolase/deacetylase ChbG (UPF0249 family)
MTTSQDRTSVELLGFSPGARVLIVNNDDFGMHDAINAAVVEAIEDGIAESCSLMVPCPSARHAMDLLRRRPKVAFGVHLTLVRDSTRHQWGPVAARRDVPSLLDTSGELFTQGEAARLLAQASLDEVELEFRAQIDAVVGEGLAPTHLDWHCLADGGRADIFDVTVALADEYGLAVRAWLDPAREKLRRRGLPVIDHAFLDSFSLGLDGKADAYAELLRGLPAGLSEWAIHPGLGDAEPVRRTDHAFLTSPTAREILRQEEITVIGYRTVQRVVNALRASR